MVSVFKIFFSKRRECQWLNTMGKKGYLLNKIADSRYYFTISETSVYTYSIEFVDAAANSGQALAYFKDREEHNVYPIVAGNNWVYFVTEADDICANKEIHINNSKFYFWRCIYLFFFSVLGSVLCGYHVFASKFIIDVGHGGDGRIDLLNVNGSGFIDTLKTIWNYVLKFINDTYLKIFRTLFGESDAVFVLAVAVPIVIVLTVLFALNLDEYLYYRFSAKFMNISKSNTSAEVNENAE